MKKELDLNPAPRILIRIITAILPRAIREEALENLKQRCTSTADWLWQSAGTTVSGYWDQFVIGVNQYGLALEILAAVYCFSVAGLAFPLFAVLGGSVLSYILRTAFTNPFSRFGPIEVAPWQYSIDSLADAVVAVFLVVFCEGVVTKISDATPLPPDMFGRGMLIFVPLMATLRMLFRPRVPANTPFLDPNLTGERVFWRVWVLNALWIAGWLAVITTNRRFLPNWVPNFFCTNIPMIMFVNWIHLQQNKLIRRDKVETLFGHWRRKRLGRLREILMKGLDKGDPMYGWYRALEGFIFFYMALPLAIDLRPWLAGEQVPRLFSLLFHVLMLFTLAWSWNYVKEANRIAADAIQQKMGQLDLSFAVA